MNISFILPSRNNLRYLKWSYQSIRKNQGNHTVQICVADDASTDGTAGWLGEVFESDPDLDYIVNDTGQRLGHTILYDRLVNEVAKYDLCIIFHADMYLCPDALSAIERHMYHRNEDYDTMKRVAGEPLVDEPTVRLEPKYKTITSLTRIEPPLHPDGPEKILADHGLEPENFNEEKFLQYYNLLRLSRSENHNDTSEGVFAPWAFWKQDFQEIGGHDPLYAPQSKEDSFHKDSYLFVERDGFKYYTTVDELWEMHSAMATVRGDGNHVVKLTGSGIGVMSPSKDGRIGMRRLNGMVRKVTPAGRLLNVRTQWGSVVVTEDHSLIDVDLNPVKVGDVTYTDVWKPTGGMTDWKRRNLLWQLEFHDTGYRSIDTYLTWTLPKFDHIDEYGNNDRLIKFCELFGFIVAEGHTHIAGTSYYVGFCSADKEIAENYARIFNELFANRRGSYEVTNVERHDEHGVLISRVYKVTVGSKYLAHFFRDQMGESSGSKQVPDFVYNLPRVYQMAFLYGYLVGDGYLGTSINRQGENDSFSVDKRLFFHKDVFDVATWKSTSKSEKLTVGINLLLNMCFPDILTRISCQAEKGSEGVYNISTCKYYSKEILEISPFESDEDEVVVYDLDVRGTDTFIGGTGLFGLHNSDIFNRFQLNGVKFVQTWEGYVYHMTCRGSRRNTIDGAPDARTDSPEWLAQNRRSTRNFIRKWGHMVMHDQYMKPIVPPKYNIEFHVFNINLEYMEMLEPWCSLMVCDATYELIDEYVNVEQSNTQYKLYDKIHGVDARIVKPKIGEGVWVTIDCQNFTGADHEYIMMLSRILQDSGVEGEEMEIGNLKLSIKSLETFEHQLIKVNKL